MDKKTLIGLLLVGVILFGYTFFTSRQQARIREEMRIADSIDRAEHPEKYVERIVGEAGGDTLALVREERRIADSMAREAAQAANLGEALVAASKADAGTYMIENDVMRMWVSTRGAQVVNVELKDYKRYGGEEPLKLFKEGSASFDMELFIRRAFNTVQINTADYVFPEVDEGTVVLADGVQASRLSMRLPLDTLSTASIEYVYTLRPDDYMVDFDVRFNGMDDYTSNMAFFNFDWKATTLQNEKGFKNENNNTTIAYRYPGAKKVQQLTPSEGSRGDKVTTRVEWLNFKQQFFSSVFLADDDFADAEFGFDTYRPGTGMIKDYRATFTVPYDPGKEEYGFSFYFGPNKYSVLRSYDRKLEKIIPLGGNLIGWINTGFTIPVANWLSKFITNYGIIILLLTVMIKLIILPLTYKSYMSSAKMRVLKPEIDALNEMYPKQEDALRKQQAMMELYRKCGVSPMGGCLPMLIQMPILIAFFRFFPAAIELRGQSFLWADDLSSYDSVLNLPFNIPLYGDHISLFTLLMALALFFYSRITYKQTASAGPQMAGMQFMTVYLMPIMMLLWFNSYASGLTYYYLLSQLFTIIIMTVIRYSVNEEKLLAKLKSNAAKAERMAASGSKTKSKWQQRYEEALRQQQQMQRQQQQNVYGGHQKTHTAKPKSTNMQPPKKRRK